MNRTAKLGVAAVGAAVLTVVLLVLFWMVVNGLGGGPQSAANGFFTSIASKGAQAAYATTSPAFQRATPVDTFVATAQASQLSSYQSSTWTKTIDKEGDKAGLAELNGVINLKGGGAIPAKVGLVKGEGGWSVLSLNLPEGGLSGAHAASTPAPDETQAPGASNATEPSVGSAQTPAPLTGLVGAETTSPSSAPDGQAESPIVVSSGRVAGICGQDILRHGRVETLDVHCTTGLTAAPGSTAQCTATINGHRQGVGATLNHFDAVSGRSDVSCHPQS